MFYTYLWLREDGTPYYVGKGKDNRGFISRGHTVSCPPINRIIVQEFKSEVDAFFAEKFLIAYYGRLDIGTGCLRNRTEGGEGTAGSRLSKEHVRKITETLKGNKRALGYRHSEETLARLREVHKGNKNLLGHIPTEETRRKLSVAGKGNKRSLGHKHTEETRSRMSEAAKKRQATERLRKCQT